MKSHFQVSQSILTAIGLGHLKDVSGMTITLSTGNYPRVDVQRLLFADEFTDSLVETVKTYELKPSTFDLDKACADAQRAVQNRIEDIYTIDRWAINRSFSEARDQMESRHRHQRALASMRRPVLEWNRIGLSAAAAALRDIANATKGLQA